MNASEAYKSLKPKDPVASKLMEPVRTNTRQSDDGASKQQTKKTDIRRKSQVKVTRQMTSEESKKISRQFTRQESVITVTSTTTTKIVNGKVVSQETDVKKSVDANMKQSSDANVRKAVEAATTVSVKQSKTTTAKALKSASVGKKVNRTPASS